MGFHWNGDPPKPPRNPLSGCLFWGGVLVVLVTAAYAAIRLGIWASNNSR